MKMLRFVWTSHSPLAKELSLGIKKLSLEMMHGHPITVTLWRSHAFAITVKSRMHDVAERREIGVLEFSDTERARSGALELLVNGFEQPVQLEKLLISEAGVTAESGIVLTGNSAQELIIVAGTYPFSLAVRAPGLSVPFDSEYPLDQYTRAPFQE